MQLALLSNCQEKRNNDISEEVEYAFDDEQEQEKFKIIMLKGKY